jgi:hypothetical protein
MPHSNTPVDERSGMSFWLPVSHRASPAISNSLSAISAIDLQIFSEAAVAVHSWSPRYGYSG